MSNEKIKLGQEPAYPTSAQLEGEAIYQEGMSKRFYAACCAMQGLLSNASVRMSESFSSDIVHASFVLADKLLKEEML